MNTAMKNAGLPNELQKEVRDYFLKVQGTMAQQEELNNFLEQISEPLKVAVYKEIFTGVLRERNQTIADTIREIVSDGNTENTNRHAALGLQSSNQYMFINERMDNFLPSIVERMGNDLVQPHHYVVQQGDKFNNEISTES